MKQCTCFALKAINCICAEREDENSFAHWFYGAPHRIKYLRDHPVFLAAQEAWDAAKKQEAEKQEPVAWRAPNWGHSADEYVYRDFDDPVIGIDGKPSPNNEPLYTHPQPKREPLTDEQIEKMRYLIDWTAHWSYGKFARAIEAAHDIKE